ncbi:hypothetical protein EVAR_72267_1, partial [Eumeta japonica]
VSSVTVGGRMACDGRTDGV